MVRSLAVGDKAHGAPFCLSLFLKQTIMDIKEFFKGLEQDKTADSIKSNAEVRIRIAEDKYMDVYVLSPLDMEKFCKLYKDEIKGEIGRELYDLFMQIDDDKIHRYLLKYFYQD